MRINHYRFPDNTAPAVLAEYDCTPDDNTIGGCSISFTKEMLKKYGGSAWTEHTDRSGSVFEVTPIVAKGNNSKVKYGYLNFTVGRV